MMDGNFFNVHLFVPHEKHESGRPSDPSFGTRFYQNKRKSQQKKSRM